MKKKDKVTGRKKVEPGSEEEGALREVANINYNTSPMTEQAMVRTQIYLTRTEHEFLQTEAGRQGIPMAAVIRGIIDAKMAIPEEAWTSNPMLDPTPDVEGVEGRMDGVMNHDHYIYGGPKQYDRQDGDWVPLPLIKE